MTSPMTNIKDIKTFLLGGNATFTIRSEVTTRHYTYRVRKVKERKDKREDIINKYFVGVLSGPDNNSDYTYIGMIYVYRDREVFYPANKVNETTMPKSANAFRWFFRNLNNNILQQCTFFHAGRCGRCNRKLTVPESIRTGIGPECANKIGA